MSLVTPNLEIPPPTPTTFTSHSRLSCAPCRLKKQRCDRTLPSCRRCDSVGLECAYPSARKSHVGKPKQVRELEAKLLQIENRLNVIGGGSGLSDGPSIPETSPALAGADHASFSIGSRGPTPLVMESDRQSSQPDCISTGEHDEEELQDDGHQIQSESSASPAINQFVSVDLVEQLTAIYFDKCYYGAPMIHRSRYMTSLRSTSALQPPRFLQFAIMATGASIDTEHESLSTILYQQARTLAEADEIKESEIDQPSVAHAQCWMLLANLEAQNGMFARAFLSLGRSIRLAQILNLHQLDRGEDRQSLFCHHPPFNDWTELEEHRRTWWVIYIADRLVSSTSGMPAVINDRQIHTLLPAAEDGFDQEIEKPTVSLEHALRARLTPNSRLATRVIASHLYHRAVDLESRVSLDEDHTGFEDDDFWSQQQDIEDQLRFVSLQLPQSLRLPRNSHSQCAIFINVLLHTANMCLHKTIMRKSRGLEGHDAEFVKRQSQSQMLSAARQIVAIIRLSQDLSNTHRNPIQEYAAYIAALLLLEDSAGNGNMESRIDAIFLFNNLRILGGSNNVAKMLAGQLSERLESLGISIMQEFGTGFGEPVPSTTLETDAPS